MDITEHWKKPICAELQDAVVLNELASKYPPHWYDILKCILTTDRIVDIGCGVGAIYCLLQKEKLSNSYLGIDFSEAMIETAKKKNPHFFIVGDYRNLQISLSNDILLCNGLLDMLPNGIDALKILLAYKPKFAILSRINIGSTEKIQHYSAYTIPIIKFTFSKSDFENTIHNSGYSIIKIHGNTFLLKRNDI